MHPETGEPFLFGGDALGRCVFSRMVWGSRIVMAIAPAATLFAYAIGITLGLPAGYFGGWLDTALTFLANLVLAFPVILLFYLLVTPEIRQTALPGHDGGGPLRLPARLRAGLPRGALPRAAGRSSR
jgi:peptide/nickel transport system permease protein